MRLQQAIEAHKGGRFAEAEGGYRGVLAAAPADADALNFLGMLCCQTERPAEGAELLRRSTEVNPANPHAWINLGNVLVRLEKDQEALEAFTRATQLAPDLPIAWFNVGVCLGRCKRQDEAASAFHRVLKLEPGYLPAYEFLSRALHRLGNYAEAAEVYREWLAHDPGNPTARHMLAATAGGEIPDRASAAYIKSLFDDFAGHFDANLMSLKYRAPQWAVERLGREVPAGAKLEVIDAGCGTGLCGPLVRPMATRLVGVDLSAQMLE
ncbi:MAG: tetratricopeptide repeat protein, partial [Steroidobacteraceae bacterium]